MRTQPISSNNLSDCHPDLNGLSDQVCCQPDNTPYSERSLDQSVVNKIIRQLYGLFYNSFLCTYQVIRNHFDIALSH